MNIEIHEIGYIENSIDKQSDENWGNIKSIVKISKDFIGGLSGLENFSHAIIITYLHEAQFIKEIHLERHPQNRHDMPLVGIFSQRAKDRPNSIGITAVRILEVFEDSLIVEGLDAINGTPVLDIKPYYPDYDRIDRVVIPEWVNRLMEHYF